ncbi:SET domain-containing protein [Xylariaceae sp. FL0016]|nr:SET domain-containing protein [Xylariaceae sp. FL0016]
MLGLGEYAARRSTGVFFSVLIGLTLAQMSQSEEITTKHCATTATAGLQSSAQLGCPLVIDDGSQDCSPWTHQPECIESEDGSGIKYCVFSNSQFGNQGVSIVTTPETAASSVDILNDAGLSHVTNPWNQTQTPPYELFEHASKGLGVRATRPIPRASTIMTDWASVLLDLSFPTSVRRQHGYRLLHRAIDQLADPDRILGLGRMPSSASPDLVENVVRTNAFTYHLGGDDGDSERPHAAVYADVARINHACRPNAFVRWIPSSLAVRVVAARDIAVGEEVTLSYIPQNHTRAERQASLRRWGFACACSLCSASKTEIAASDYRRSKMRDLRAGVAEAIDALDGTRAVRLTHEILELLRAEEIPSLYAGQYEILARLYGRAGDRETAARYARISLETRIDQGALDDRIEEYLPPLLATLDG